MAYYELTVKMNKSKMAGLKKKLNKTIMKEAAPVMHKTIRDLILYKKLEPGQGKSFAEFLVSHAGLFSAGIINRMNKKHIKFGMGSESGVSVGSISNGTELIIKSELTDEAKAEFADLSADKIMNMVVGLNQSTIKSVFRIAADKAGLD